MLINLQRKIKSISILDVIKIGIIIFVSFSLLANFIHRRSRPVARVARGKGDHGELRFLW